MFEHADETVALFTDLVREVTPDGRQLRGMTAPGRVTDLLAVDSMKNVYVLLEDLSSGPLHQTRRFSSISILPSQSYRLEVDGKQVEKKYVALVLHHDKVTLLSAFAITSSALLASLPLQPNAADISSYLETFVELFLNNREVDAATVKGVWGELWVLASADDPASLLECWHDSQFGHFDFSRSGVHIEVKTHEGERSFHHFSAAQLSIDASTTFIVSCLIFSDNGGKTAMDLIDEISVKLSGPQRTQLLRKALESLGTGLEEASEFRYEVRNGLMNQVLLASEMPVLSFDDRAPVSQISYSVDMSELLKARGSNVDHAILQLLS